MRRRTGCCIGLVLIAGCANRELDVTTEEAGLVEAELRTCILLHGDQLYEGDGMTLTEDDFWASFGTFYTAGGDLNWDTILDNNGEFQDEYGYFSTTVLMTWYGVCRNVSKRGLNRYEAYYQPYNRRSNNSVYEDLVYDESAFEHELAHFWIREIGARQVRQRLLEQKEYFCQLSDWQRLGAIDAEMELIVSSVDHVIQGLDEYLDLNSTGYLLPNGDDHLMNFIDFSYLDQFGVGAHAETIQELRAQLDDLQEYEEPTVMIDCNRKPR